MGWSAYIWGPQSKKWLRLPNTTLRGEFENLDAADKAFDAGKAKTVAAGYTLRHLDRAADASYNQSEHWRPEVGVPVT